MYKVAEAMKTFFSSFGIPAYSVDTVPDDVETPYISFMLQEPEWNQKASGYAQVWYRTRSNSTAFAKADAIVKAIGLGKVIKLSGGGYLVIYPETPNMQLMVDGDYRAVIINYSINTYHMPGE